MKKLILVISLLISSVLLFSQNFAPIGATWHYQSTEMGDTSFVKIESVGDTTILGHLCQTINLPETGWLSGTVFVYSTVDSVFLYNHFLTSFQLLYAFNAQVSDSWSFTRKSSGQSEIDTVRITVNSIFSQTINGNTLRSLDVTYESIPVINWPSSTWVYNSTIVEHIGDMNYLFHFQHYIGMIDGGPYPKGLRCYSDNTFGFYDTGLSDSCEHEATYVGIQKIETSSISIWPNPVQKELHVSASLNIDEIQIFDITGKLIFNLNKNQRMEALIDMSEFDNGIYFVQVTTSKGIEMKKILKRD